MNQDFVIQQIDAQIYNVTEGQTDERTEERIV